jgi:hypothetical protein
MALLCLNHSQGYVKPTYPGQVQPRLALAAGTRLSRLPCITRVRRGRPVGLPCAAQRQNIVEGGLPQQNNSPATTIISYAKLLTLTGVMAAAVRSDAAHGRGYATRLLPLVTGCCFFVCTRMSAQQTTCALLQQCRPAWKPSL